jgi:hypothetical protein
VLPFVFDSDGDTDPDTDACEKGSRPGSRKFLILSARQGVQWGRGCNGVRSVRLTLEREALPRSFASQLPCARFQNLRIPCIAAASQTPGLPSQHLRPAPARTEEWKSGQVHDGTSRSGAVDSQRFWDRQGFINWIDLPQLPPPPGLSTRCA